MLGGPVSAVQTSYQGITFITPQAGYAAVNQLTAYAKDHPDSPLAKLADAAAPMPLLSQTLDGLHDRLLLRRQTLQLEARDPYFQGDQERAFIDRVRAALAAGGGGANTMAPMVEDAFSPVRAGAINVKALWLVDAFGQYRSYRFGPENHDVTAARSLSPARLSAVATQPHAFLPPRLAQPARLEVKWLAAGDALQQSLGSQLSSSPICGWIVPNYLDGSLMIYDAIGAALGSVAAVDGQIGWLGSPANPASFGVPPQVLFQSQNERLWTFVEAFLVQPEGTGYLTDFLKTLNNASATIHPLQHAQSAQMPMLVGQPLALVRATIALRTMSDPAVNNTWAAFEQDLGAAGTRTTNGHEEVTFPVLLGAPDDPDDGVVGFFVEGGDWPYGKFHTVTSDTSVFRSGRSITPRDARTVTVSAKAAPVTVAMLIDPRCAVHAITGYLPLQTIAVPPEKFRAALSRIAVTFLTAPVLSAAAASAMELPLPLPGQQSGQWSWASVAAVDNLQKPVSSPTETLKPDRPFANPSYRLRDGWLTLTASAKDAE